MPHTDPALRALHQRGLVHLNAQRADAAIAIFREVLQKAPDDIDSWDHLAAALTMDRDFAEAEAAFQQCFRLGCDFPETLRNAVLNARLWGKPELQLHHARRLLALDGELRLEGLRHSAEALGRCGRHTEALAACRQLLLEKPGDFASRQSSLRILLDAGQVEQALALCEELLQEQPENRAVQLARIEACMVAGEIETGIAWAEALLQAEPDNIDALASLGFHYQFLPDMSVARRRTHAERFAAVLRRKVQACDHWSNDRDAERPLRVGLVSGDLRQHPVAYFLVTVLEALQQSSLEFTVYDTLGNHDSMTARIRPSVRQWRNLQGRSDKDAVELIRSDGIDILIDLHGYTTGHRLTLMAHKPAPVQLAWLGFLGSTGTPGIDYVLADRFCVPPGTEQEFTEQIWRLPEHAQCFSEPDVPCPLMPPPVLDNGFITFGCLNKPNKLNDRVLALWSRVLAAVPESRLYLKGGGFMAGGYREQLIRRMENLGIDPERVILEGRVRREDFLLAYNQMDIALDPFPYSGATTTAEALWAGVPVLALAGDRMVWRMATSFLTAAGMGDWVASTPEQFVELAVAKATDISGLAELRKRQRELVLKSRLFDAPRFAGDLERSLRAIWREYVERNSEAEKIPESDSLV